MRRKKVKVAFLDYSHIFAGAERVLCDMLANLDREKYEPILVFPFPREHQKRYDSIDCEKVWLNDSVNWWMGSDRWSHPVKGTDLLKRSILGMQLAVFVKQRGVDVLDVNLMRNDVMMWVWATRKLTHARIMGHYRSHVLEWIAPPSAQKLFDLIVCVSRYSMGRYLSKGRHTDVKVLYDAVNVSGMCSELTKEDAKVKLGFRPEDILISSVGQLSEHKGHDNAIRAFANISAEFPSAKLLIAGGGGKGNLMDYYRSIIREEGVSDKVVMTGKQIADIQTVYRASDLTLTLTKVGEGFGLVPYESALLGTPFIAPEFGAVTEFVKDMDNGLLVDTNHIDAIAEKMRWVLSHPDDAQSMVCNLRKLIHKELTPQRLAENLDKTYQYILDKH